MPGLKDAAQGFKTGDLIITYLPRGGTRPMHVTIYLEPADSPSNAPAFIHAATDGVVIEPIGAWEKTTKSLEEMNTTITNKPDKMLEKYPEFFPDQNSLSTATTTDLLWLAIQILVLGISTYTAVRLNS